MYENMFNKKVLLRERKRHTARRVAIASPCYSGGGAPLTKFFSPVWTCIKPNLVSKIFPFTGGGGVPWQKFFFCPEMYQAKSGVKNFPFTGRGGVPQQKIFLLVWTCIKPNLVSKFFPLLGGRSLDKIFFCQSEHVSGQIWCQKFFPFTLGGSLNKKSFSGLNMYQAKSGVKNFSLYWDQVSPQPGPGTPLEPETRYPPGPRPGPPGPGPGTPPDLDLGPPTWTWTWDPPTWTWDPSPQLDLGPPYLDLDLWPPGPGPGTPPGPETRYLPWT